MAVARRPRESERVFLLEAVIQMSVISTLMCGIRRKFEIQSAYGSNGEVPTNLHTIVSKTKFDLLLPCAEYHKIGSFNC